MINLFTNPNLKTVLQQVLDEKKQELTLQKKESDREGGVTEKPAIEEILDKENCKKVDKLELTRKLTSLKGEAKFEHYNLIPGQVWIRNGSQGKEQLTVEGIWQDLSKLSYLVKFKELGEIFDTHRSNLVSKLSGFIFSSGPDPERGGTVIDGDLKKTSGSLAFKRSLGHFSRNELSSIDEKPAEIKAENQEVEIVRDGGKLKLFPGKEFKDNNKGLTVLSVEKIDPINIKIAFKEIANGQPETHSDTMWFDMLKNLFGEKIFE